MGWRMSTALTPRSRNSSKIRREMPLLPTPVRTAHTLMTGLVDATMLRAGPTMRKSAPARQHERRLVHQVGVCDVAVGEEDVVDIVRGDEVGKLALRVDRDAIGVTRARQHRRERPVVDAGNLSGREGDDVDRRVLLQRDQEVVEVATGGSHDDGATRLGCSGVLGGHGRSSRLEVHNFPAVSHTRTRAARYARQASRASATPHSATSSDVQAEQRVAALGTSVRQCGHSRSVASSALRNRLTAFTMRNSANATIRKFRIAERNAPYVIDDRRRHVYGRSAKRLTCRHR